MFMVIPLMNVLFGNAVCASTDTNAGNRAVSQAVPIRLAICGFAVRTDVPDIQKLNTRLTDLLAVKLSQAGGIELVERQKIESVGKEIGLSLAQISRAEDTIKAGQLLRADWIVIGALTKAEGGHTLIVKIVDARTGILRDLTVFSLDENNLSATVDRMALFLTGSTSHAPGTGQRIFIGIGGFEDLSINNQYPDFRKNLRTAMEKACLGTQLSIVERAMVNPLLTELQLNLAGLTAGGPQPATAQPAFFLVDGFYQSYRDDKSKINLVLRIEKIGGGRRLVILNEPPGKDIETKAAESINTAINELRLDNVAVSRKEEASIQLERGKDRARLPASASYEVEMGCLGGYFEQSDREKRLRNISEAIEAFESALLLDPENMEARLYLAICLIDPGIGKKDAGRDYLKDVITVSTNAGFTRLARKKLVESYVGEDDRQALNVILAQAQEAKTPPELAESLGYQIVQPLENLRRNGRISIQEAVEIYKKRYLAGCDAYDWNAARGVFGMDPFPSVMRNTFTLFERINDFDKSAGERCLDELLPQAAEKHPGQAPYIWTAYIMWRSSQPPTLLKRFRDSLAFCRDHPENVPEIHTFYAGYLPSVIQWSVLHRDPDLEEISGDIMQQALTRDNAEGGEIQSYWSHQQVAPQIYYHLAYSYSDRGKWDEALKTFEWLQNRFGVVTMEADGPWGRSGTQVFTGEEVAKCRQHLGLPAQPNTATIRRGPVVPAQPVQPPLAFKLGEPVLTVGHPMIFACDGDQIWLVDGFSPFVYQKSSGRLDEIEWPESIERNVTTIRAGKTKVWWATEGSGLVELDKQTRRCRVYTEKDGLLLPNIQALDLTEDRLWMAFGKIDVGGIGYLDLKTQKFTGFTPELTPENLPKPKQNRFQWNQNSPSRAFIAGVSQVSSNDLWFASERTGLEHYSLDRKSWSPKGLLGLWSLWCLAGNSRYIVIGGVGNSGGVGDPGGLAIYMPASGNWDNVAIRDWLKPERLEPRFAPHEILVLSLAIDGDRLWVGGLGFLALVDLNSRRVEKLCDFDDREIHVRCLQIQGDDLWVAVENKLYRLPKMGPPAQ